MIPVDSEHGLTGECGLCRLTRAACCPNMTGCRAMGDDRQVVDQPMADWGRHGKSRFEDAFSLDGASIGAGWAI